MTPRTAGKIRQAAATGLANATVGLVLVAAACLAAAVMTAASGTTLTQVTKSQTQQENP
jgi:hypothetical protein